MEVVPEPLLSFPRRGGHVERERTDHLYGKPARSECGCQNADGKRRKTGEAIEIDEEDAPQPRRSPF